MAKIYLNYIYGEQQYLELIFIYQIFYDCLFYAARLLNSSLNYSVYAKEALNSIIKSIDVNENKVSKDDLLIWILSEFPDLFYGYHNWILSRVKNFKINFQVG